MQEKAGLDKILCHWVLHGVRTTNNMYGTVFDKTLIVVKNS